MSLCSFLRSMTNSVWPCIKSVYDFLIRRFLVEDVSSSQDLPSNFLPCASCSAVAHAHLPALFLASGNKKAASFSKMLASMSLVRDLGYLVGLPSALPYL